MTFTIIGCGGIGSWLSFYLCLSHSDKPLFSKLRLFDYDNIEVKNLPYLYSNDMQIVNHNKATVLKSIIDKLDTGLEVEDIPYFCDILNYKKENNEIVIDCRDSNSCSSSINIKARMDGKNGILMVYPDETNSRDTPNNYIMKPNNLDMSSFASDIVRYIKSTNILKGDKNILFYGY